MGGKSIYGFSPIFFIIEHPAKHDLVAGESPVTRAGLEQNHMRYEDYQTYLSAEEDPEETSTNLLKTHPVGLGITIEGLTFRYPTNETDTLKNINLTIKPGSKVAFVGENGSGKSTLIKMILGLYKPTTGSIKWYLDNQEIEANQVAKYCRVVFQDYTRLLRPVRENVAIGDMTKLDDDLALMNALESANANDFIKDLDSHIGPQFGGIDLSGGQWQRLATGRAYLRESLLTVFDEPTAALDPNSEKKAFEMFINLGGQQTSIIITHRLYMAKFVDEIYMFRNGEIVEHGTHEELIRAKGEYEKMFTQQASLYAIQSEVV